MADQQQDPVTAFDGPWWETRYAGHHGPAVNGPSPHLAEAATELPVGRALDAGCGEGADAVWLAERGWRVTAVDISSSALARAGALAEQAGVRVDWEVADLDAWEPATGFDLVTSHYVHTTAPTEELVGRLAAAVAPGGTLLVVGHAPGDAHSSEHAPVDASATPGQLAGVLDADAWEIVAGGVRRRTAQVRGRELTLDDSVLHARRR